MDKCPNRYEQKAIRGLSKLRRGLHWPMTILAALAAGLLLLSSGTQVVAQAALTFTATDIAAAVPPPVLTPLASSPTIDSTPVPAGLPAGVTARFVITGVVAAKDAAGQAWQIGTPPVFVYTSGSTRIDNAPIVGDRVRAIGNRTLSAGPIVAERIALTQRGPAPASPANVTLTFVFTGALQTIGNHIWIIGGNDFIVDDPAAPTTIAGGLLQGSTVTVTFTAAPAAAPPGGTTPPPPPAADAPPATATATPPDTGATTASATTSASGISATAIPISAPAPVAPTFGALQIFAPVPAPVISPTISSPRIDSTPLPAVLPAGSTALFIVTGVVTARDTAGLEWQVGTQPVFVYTRTGTKVFGSPKVGDSVKVIANRSLVPGPLVADSITLRQAGPLSAGTASVAVSFLLTGPVGTADSHIWTVRGINFVVDGSSGPAVISEGLGNTVTVEFGGRAVPVALSAPGVALPPAPLAPPALIAREIFASPPARALTPSTPNPRADSTPVAAGLPKGTTALLVVSGVVKGKDDAGLEWQIGTQPVFVYAHTGTRVIGSPKIGDAVKVVAARSLQPGPIVAETITLLERGPMPASPASINLSYLFTGDIVATNPRVWKVGGNNFILDDPAGPAIIDPGLGNTVTVEFDAAGALAEIPSAAPAPTIAQTSTSRSSELRGIRPLAASRARVTNALGPIVGKLARVWGMDPNTKEWKLFDPSLPNDLNTLVEMEVGRAYFIKVSEPAALTTGGIAKDLFTGWNLVAWAG